MDECQRASIPTLRSIVSPYIPSYPSDAPVIKLSRAVALVHPDAGTNRTNAVSRDNLMNGLGLKYNGQYINKDLDFVGTDGFWWMSAIRNNTYSYSSRINTDGYIYPQGQSVQNMGRAVRCIPPTLLVVLVQDLIHCRMYILATITGVQVGFTARRWKVATGHLVLSVVPIAMAWV